MRIGDTAQVRRACGLIANVQGIQRFNAEAGLRFARIGLTGERALLVVQHPGRPPLHLKVDYDITRQALGALLAAHGLPVRPESAEIGGYDDIVTTPRPQDPGEHRHGYVLYEVCDTSAWDAYHEGRSWRGELTDIVYTPASTDLLVRLDAVAWRVRVKLPLRESGGLIGIAYSVVDRITTLVEDPSPDQREQMRHGEVVITYSYRIHGT
ncbi:hypothetical protein HS048_35365 [Planomonospora sp. ID91781]|uniref:hypothetical protein n=1 Tax=Planomonospora sp. ID91781 TaxID=2738135 RepID=UPI0018C3EAEB|nr:hypothetical protein [Planomonospora sp. ID91781]MBG0825953.1 hypothetical protein [Planomonospora sp. ID91781]